MEREEAINIVRNNYQTDAVKEALRTLIPELKESEDERMRRKLIDHLDWCSNNGLTHKECDELRAWLEKQKEPKHLTPEEKVKHPLYIEGFEAGKEVGAQYEKVFKERKPDEWSEDYREEGIQTRFAFYTYKDDPSVLYLSNVFVEEASRNHGFGTRILKAAEKAAEAIGAISIRLKVKQDSLANAWYRNRGYGYFTFEGEYDWLEKTLEYLKPSKTAEWSEEDKKLLETVIRIIELNIVDGSDIGTRATASGYIGKSELIKRLKSLKPQPHWKPSDKQMRALKNARYMMSQSGDYYDTAQILDFLIDDLKKLT